jgi:UDP-N-acetylmuramoylalanine-D-glutamate ligase
VGGNLGSPPWDPQAPADADWYVIEVSSYQATDITVGPRVVAVTSLSQDHLIWHGGPERYFADKLSLCTRPGVERVVADGSDDLLRQHSVLLGSMVEWVEDAAGSWADGLGLLGAHNRRNAALARVALIAAGVPGADDESALARAALGYEPLPSRLCVFCPPSQPSMRSPVDVWPCSSEASSEASTMPRWPGAWSPAATRCSC